MLPIYLDLLMQELYKNLHKKDSLRYFQEVASLKN